MAKYNELSSTTATFRNGFLKAIGEDYDEATDSADRAKCLARLKEYSRADFLEDDGRRNYRDLSGAMSWKEGLADIFGEVADSVGVAEPLIRWFAKDVAHYWEPDAAFGKRGSVATYGAVEQRPWSTERMFCWLRTASGR